MLEAIREPGEDAGLVGAALHQASFLHGSLRRSGQLAWHHASAWIARAVRRMLLARAPLEEHEEEEEQSQQSKRALGNEHDLDFFFVGAGRGGGGWQRTTASSVARLRALLHSAGRQYQTLLQRQP